MKKKFILHKKISLVAIFTISLLLISVAGCSKNEASTPESDMQDSGAVSGEPDENGNLLTGSDVPNSEAQPEVYANCFEAYLDILTEDSQMLTDANIEYQRTVGGGKIAVLNVTGDETPELLYIYLPKDNDTDECLKIFTYSKADGVEQVFNARVISWAGGGGNYCIYLTRNGELLLYCSSHNLTTAYGFWPIVPNQNLEIVEDYGAYLYRSDLARLFYVKYFEGTEYLHYTQNGKEISKADFDKAANEMMGDIGQVIFQSTGVGEYGLYERDDLWKGIAPFEESCMTYDEAIAWLEAQGDGQEQK